MTTSETTDRHTPETAPLTAQEVATVEVRGPNGEPQLAPDPRGMSELAGRLGDYIEGQLPGEVEYCLVVFLPPGVAGGHEVSLGCAGRGSDPERLVKALSFVAMRAAAGEMGA